MKRIDIRPTYASNEFNLYLAKTTDQFRRSGLYPIVAAAGGASFCQEDEFYHFLYEKLLQDPKFTGDVWHSGAGLIERSDTTTYPTKEFCGLSFTYRYGSADQAGSWGAKSGDFEVLSLKPL